CFVVYRDRLGPGGIAAELRPLTPRLSRHREEAIAARSIWKGAISFGMVSIPVALFSAAQSKDLSFNMLHKDCHSRIKQVRRCPVHEVDLEAGDIVKGYEYAKGQYVVLTDEDFERVSIPSKHTIEVIAFVDAEEIDPVYYEKAYSLQPEEL